MQFGFFGNRGYEVLARVGRSADGDEREVEQADDFTDCEADEFARNLLIPKVRAPELKRLRTERAIREFARQIGVSTGIVVGRMQHDQIVYPSAFNGLKRKLEWA